MRYKGSCHCAKVTFDVEGELNEALECNCTHCQRKGLLLWFLPRDRMSARGADALSTYKFNKHVLDHKFCPGCGTQPFTFGKKGDAEMVAINVRCLEDVALANLKRIPYNGRAA